MTGTVTTWDCFLVFVDIMRLLITMYFYHLKHGMTFMTPTIPYLGVMKS